MNPGNEPRQIFTRILDLMLKAGWLHHHAYTEGKGFHLAWSVKGAARASGLSRIIQGCSLDEGDKTPLVFDILAYGERLPSGFSFLGDAPDEEKAAWREAVAELGLRGDEDGLLAMVHIVEGWKPG